MCFRRQNRNCPLPSGQCPGISLGLPLHCIGGAAGRVLDQHSRGLIDLQGSCPWPRPWAWPHGAHLRCRFPGSISHGHRGPALGQSSSRLRHVLRQSCAARTSFGAAGRDEPRGRRRLRRASSGRRPRPRQPLAPRDRRPIFRLRASLRPCLSLKNLRAPGSKRLCRLPGGGGTPLVFRSWRPGEPTLQAKWRSRSLCPPRRKPRLIFCSCPWPRSTGRGTGSAMARAFTIALWLGCEPKRRFARWASPMRARSCRKFRTDAHDESLDYVLTERELIGCRVLRYMRLLFVGDIVGRAGRAVLFENLPNCVKLGGSTSLL